MDNKIKRTAVLGTVLALKMQTIPPEKEKGLFSGNLSVRVKHQSLQNPLLSSSLPTLSWLRKFGEMRRRVGKSSSRVSAFCGASHRPSVSGRRRLLCFPRRPRPKQARPPSSPSLVDTSLRGIFTQMKGGIAHFSPFFLLNFSSAENAFSLLSLSPRRPRDKM